MLAPSELTPAEEIRSRITRLQNVLIEKEIDLALILQNVDLFYFTGTIQNGYLFIPRQGEPLFFVQKDFARAIAESPLKPLKVESLKELPKRVQEQGLNGKKVGMEFDVVPVSVFNRIGGSFQEIGRSKIFPGRSSRSEASRANLRSVRSRGRARL